MKKGEVGEYFSKCNCIKYAVENLVTICEDILLILLLITIIILYLNAT